MGTLYSRGEVAWLLSISHREAIELDASQPDSCSRLSADDTGHSCSTDEPMLAVLRWHDVHAARRTIAESKVQALVLRLRRAGYTERQVVDVFKTPKTTMRRRWDATITEIVRLLGETEDQEHNPTVNACLICGKAARVRLAAEYRLLLKGRRKESKPERASMVCGNCLSPDLGRLPIGMR
jgi:hypothetical protein